MKEFIAEQLRKLIIENRTPELRFNGGSFNKLGPNTIYMDGEPIIDFGVGQIGDVTVNGKTINNGLFLQGGYNAAKQKQGYGKMGLEFIFNKLPKIQNIVLQCYDTAYPFWKKMGGEIIFSKDIANSGKPLHTVVITRDSFFNRA